MPRISFLLASLTLLTTSALAADPAAPAHANADHPAVAQQRLAAHASIDPNTFLVQPPASVHWTAAPAATQHAGGAHPAVIVAARTAAGIDPNTFLVQPPATTAWTAPAPTLRLADATR
ncbi:hypothetical protein KAK07_09910 [Ideonella sp. 4Y16]|uniref:Uncharacterized protein n=1 Tax=Ideonella alba TaxID=2824118 RepID=A0A941BCP2_9BURK|nr:hypothetical protein [Ideonella alba]MBQ0932145.1 hypothetical protein [Ideonella alba]MBQ0943651.1 hypothetical protein [Ideonella alba]